MHREIWLRNVSQRHLPSLARNGYVDLAYSRGYVLKSGRDPVVTSELRFRGMPWRVLIVADYGTVEYRPGSTQDRPTAVHPTWEYGWPTEDLVAMMKDPDWRIPQGEKRAPVHPPSAQDSVPRRVVVTRLPEMKSAEGKKFMALCRDVQELFPETILHLHGLYAIVSPLDARVRAFDAWPFSRLTERVLLPNGTEVDGDRIKPWGTWLAATGWSVEDLETPEDRLACNLDSLRWMAVHWESVAAWRVQGRSRDELPDTESSVPQLVTVRRQPTKGPPLIKNRAAPIEVGDRVICDVCSVQYKCKHYRAGAICIVPESETVKLAEFFKSRNAETVIDGLSALMSAQAKRVQRALELEAIDGDVLEQASKEIQQLFNQGVKFVKLVDPRRAGGGNNVLVNVNGGAISAGRFDPKGIAAAAMAELEASGVERGDMSPEMILEAISTDTQSAITATSQEVTHEGQ